MGFDTYLEVDDRIALMWRKYKSPLPRMLFRRDQAIAELIDPPSENGADLRVEFESTASKVIATLDGTGLGWPSTVAAYERIRQGVVAQSSLFVRLSAPSWKIAQESSDPGEILSEEEVQARIDKWNELSPEHDLKEAGTFLAAEWQNLESEVSLFKDITYDGQIEPMYSYIASIMDRAENRGMDWASIGRFVESWTVLYREAPLLAWPMLICVLLKQMPPDCRVSYVLTEDAQEYSVELEGADEYFDDYWRQSAEGLVSQASMYARLFGVLAAFDSQVGKEFWFTRASEALAKLESMASAPEKHSTKARGDALEELVDSLVRTEEPDLKVLVKNYKTSEEEIDLVLRNGLGHPFWAALSSPILLIECKNWKGKAGVSALRVLESKMKDRGALARVGVFVSVSGFTKPFLVRLKSIQGETGVIFPVSGSELRKILAERRRLSDWLAEEGAVQALGQ